MGKADHPRVGSHRFRAISVWLGLQLHIAAVRLHLPGLAVVAQAHVQDLPEPLALLRLSTGAAASTRRERLRYIQSAEPM